VCTPLLKFAVNRLDAVNDRLYKPFVEFRADSDPMDMDAFTSLKLTSCDANFHIALQLISMMMGIIPSIILLVQEYMWRSGTIPLLAFTLFGCIIALGAMFISMCLVIYFYPEAEDAANALFTLCDSQRKRRT